MINEYLERLQESNTQNYKSYISKFEDFIKEFDYKKKDLYSNEYGTGCLYIPKKKVGKQLLIIAGQHGEEGAGPWGLLSGLKKSKNLLVNNSISIIPVFNIYGFSNGKRNGENGDKTNWVLNKKLEFLKKPGLEVKSLIDNFDLLRKLGKDGLLNIHEDITSNGFYLYVLGDSNHNTVKELIKTGLSHFKPKKNGIYNDNETYELKDGIINNHPDYSFDHAMSLNNIPLAITIECPAINTIDFKDRISYTADMVKTFISNMQ